MANKRRVVYASPSEKEKWSVKGEGAQRALKNFGNKKDAVDFGRQVAKNADQGQLKTQKRVGTFQKEYACWSDPYPPEG